jgi:hypothetical protein
VGGMRSWTRTDYALEGSYLMLHFIDWRQTRTIAKDDDYHERNPILGRDPSVREVDVYFAVTTVLHPIVSHFLPKPYRTWWQGITVTVAGTCVIHNWHVGIRMDW